MGSLSAVVGREVSLDSYLPDWLEEGIESSLRDSEDDAPPVPIAVQSISSAQSISSSSPRAIASSSRNGNTPVVLTPTGPSPSGSYTRQNGKGNWTDLDTFYADAGNEEEVEEEEESEEEEDEEEDGEEGESGEEGEEDESGEEAASGDEPETETDSTDEDADERAHILHHAR